MKCILGKKPGPIDFFPKPLENSNVENVPVSVIAGNRPLYLFRMLKRLLNTPGVDISMVTVYIDGFFDEVKAVTELFNLQFVNHHPVCSKNCRISQVCKRYLDMHTDIPPFVMCYR